MENIKNIVFYQLPSSIEPILKSKYWYMVNEFLLLLKQNKKIFDLQKFKKHQLIYKSELNIRKNKWDFIASQILTYEENDIPIFILKYIYNKSLQLYTLLKLEVKKKGVEMEALIQSINSQIEKFVFENNIKYIYSQNELVHLIISFKDLFKERVSLEPTNNSKKGSFIHKFNKKKLITQLARSPFFTGYVQNDIENKQMQDKKLLAIEQLIQKENTLNFYFGKLNSYFKKSEVIVDDDAKLLHGKLFNVFSLEKHLKTAGLGLLSMGNNALGDLLDNKNSYFFPSDNEKFKRKTFDKLQANALLSQTLNNDTIEKINQKFKKLSFIKSVTGVNWKIEDNKLSKVHQEQANKMKSSKAFSFLGSLTGSDEGKSNTVKNNSKNKIIKISSSCLIPLLSNKFNNSTALNTAISLYESQVTEKQPIKKSATAKFSFFKVNETNNKAEELSNQPNNLLLNLIQNNGKNYCTKEMLLNELQKPNGVNLVKEKIFKINRNFPNMSKREISQKTEEILSLLNNLKNKREFYDKEHKKFINIIKNR